MFCQALFIYFDLKIEATPKYNKKKQKKRNETLEINENIL